MRHTSLRKLYAFLLVGLSSLLAQYAKQKTTASYLMFLYSVLISFITSTTISPLSFSIRLKRKLRSSHTKQLSVNLGNFLFNIFTFCLGCSKEPSHWDSSFENPQHMFWLRNKKNIFFVTHSCPEALECNVELVDIKHIHIKLKLWSQSHAITTTHAVSFLPFPGPGGATNRNTYLAI